MARTDYERRQRELEIAFERATQVPIYVRMTVPDPKANADWIPSWVTNHVNWRKWSVVNRALHPSHRVVKHKFFRALARIHGSQSGTVTSVVLGTSPSNLAPASISIPFGSRPVIRSVQLVSG